MPSAEFRITPNLSVHVDVDPMTGKVMRTFAQLQWLVGEKFAPTTPTFEVIGYTGITNDEEMRLRRLVEDIRSNQRWQTLLRPGGPRCEHGRKGHERISVALGNEAPDPLVQLELEYMIDATSEVNA